MAHPRLSLIILGAVSLCGCASTTSNTAGVQDFGRALREDIAAQIADPDALSRPHAPPMGDGERVGLAEERYRTGKVIEPAAAAASTVGASTNSPNAAPAAPTPGSPTTP